VADFSVKDGIMTSNTDRRRHRRGAGKGKGDDRSGKRADGLPIEGDSKKPRLVRLFMPITISGPFMAPKVGFKPTKVVSQGGIAAALGTLVNPLAACCRSSLPARPRTPTARAWSRMLAAGRGGEGGADHGDAGEEIVRKKLSSRPSAKRAEPGPPEALSRLRSRLSASLRPG
jgi:hypothetical protein